MPALASTLLFHDEIGIPDCVVAAIRKLGTLPLFYTQHALDAAERDHLGRVSKLPYAINCAIDTIQIIEVEVDPWRNSIEKVVFRMPLTNRRDLIMAVSADRGRNVVKTVWTNYKNDTHTTLRKGRYNRPADYFRIVRGA